MTGVPALRFASVARSLGTAARASGLEVPAFRSPPRIPDVNRSIRRYPGGSVVSVKIKGRPLGRVVEDMVDGVLISNRVRGEASPRLRLALLRAALGEFLPETQVLNTQVLNAQVADGGGAEASPVIRADSLPEALAASTLEEPARVAERHTQAA
ncbi:MAG: hypothetical protein JHC94_09095 [Acidimicrobiia bacterium]|nr:hypothetical protein [Acidimicrobiia bacterium]MBJ7381916.1 hypothetical protein [Acidimicrobiia bacterium]MBJ7514463.1 hypothetical protein [Acidimicrobiia bacterium]